MEARKNVIINERTIKGYIELHKAYTEPANEGKVMLKKVLTIIAAGFAVSCGMALVFSAPIQAVVLPIVASNLIGIGVLHAEETKERKELKKKYPYLDLTLSCEDLEEILVNNDAIVYDDECFYHYDENVLERKQYVDKCNEILNEVVNENRDYSIVDYTDVPRVEIPKVKKLGTIPYDRNRISK